MKPQLLDWTVCSPLPWKLDGLHGIVDAEDFPIGLGGTEAQKLAFIGWLQDMPQLGQAARELYDAYLDCGVEGDDFNRKLQALFAAMMQAEFSLEREEDVEEVIGAEIYS